LEARWVRQKTGADVVVFWGCNPVEAHPRHPTRYSVMARGFLTKGRSDRRVIVVDVRKTPTAYLATDFYMIKPNSDFAIFTALRNIINGHEGAVPDIVGGLKKEELIELAKTLESAKYGLIFFGLGVTHTRGHERNIEAVIKLGPKQKNEVHSPTDERTLQRRWFGRSSSMGSRF